MISICSSFKQSQVSFSWVIVMNEIQLFNYFPLAGPNLLLFCTITHNFTQLFEAVRYYQQHIVDLRKNHTSYYVWLGWSNILFLCLNMLKIRIVHAPQNSVRLSSLQPHACLQLHMTK